MGRPNVTLKESRLHISALLLADGWNQSRQARALGISHQRVRQLLTDTKTPDTTTAVRLAAMSGVPLAHLVVSEGRWIEDAVEVREEVSPRARS